jgi:hypothetical protein
VARQNQVQKQEALTSLRSRVTKELLEAVIECGGTDDDLRRISENDELRNKLARFIVDEAKEQIEIEPTFIESTHSVNVNGELSLDAMIKAARFDWIHEDVNAKNFLITSKDQYVCEVLLLGFKQTVSPATVEAELRTRGLRAARIEELLALAAQHPELQRKHMIAAIGSLWKWPDGERHFPYLHSYHARREIKLSWYEPDDGWTFNFRFAAVKI